MEVLKLEKVCKRIGKRNIIKDLTLSVNEGQIFGFLGKNGAGKTTTIRMIASLLKPDSGKIYIGGYDVASEKEKALRNVGCIIENPDMYNFLSGKKNLIQYARLYGNVPIEKIDEVISLVGLKERIDDKVKNYSLGMKQRLGLAQALLPNPKLIVLDEPTNGLDPIGIIELREIIKKLAVEKKMGVLVSSHILGEIVQYCDTVGIINDGQIKLVEQLDGKDQGELEERFIDVLKEG